MKDYTPRLIDLYKLPKDSTHEDCIKEAVRRREYNQAFNKVFY